MFSSAAVEIALASYPGFHVTAPPGTPHPSAVHAGYVDAKLVEHVAVVDGVTTVIPSAVETRELEPVAEPELPEPLGGPTRNVHSRLGLIDRWCPGERANKAQCANVGVRRPAVSAQRERESSSRAARADPPPARLATRPPVSPDCVAPAAWSPRGHPGRAPSGSGSSGSATGSSSRVSTAEGITVVTPSTTATCSTSFAST